MWSQPHFTLCSLQKVAPAMGEHLTSVNIPDMDEQHRELYSAVMALKESPDWVERLGGVINAVEAHFQAEEALFEKYAIPNVITHRSEHARFLTTLRKKHDELFAKSEANEDVSGELGEVVQSSIRWLKIHTNAYDAPQYGTFFKNGEYVGPN